MSNYGTSPVKDAYWVVTDKDGKPIDKKKDLTPEEQDLLIRDFLLASATYLNAKPEEDVSNT